MATIGHIAALTSSVLEGFLREQELARTLVEFVDTEGRRRPDNAEASESDYVKVLVLGEKFYPGLIAHQSDADWVRMFTWEFTTFIQESKFGFGESR